MGKCNMYRKDECYDCVGCDKEVVNEKTQENREANSSASTNKLKDSISLVEGVRDCLNSRENLFQTFGCDKDLNTAVAKLKSIH